jgi:hypothetical protein
MGDDLMATVDADTLSALREVRELRIPTEKHPESAVVIWVAVADGEVFVRSFRGAKGRWYRDLANGAPPLWNSPAGGWRCRRSQRTSQRRSSG